MGQLERSTQLLICLGSGGVGKTSVSGGIALSLAQQGYKTLIVTIDPSKRLASALGFREDGNNEIVVEGTSGLLTAKLSEPESVFTDYLKDQLEDSLLLDKLSKNHLFQQLTTSLGGSQEFSSIYQLVRSFEGDYDWIVLDTPPATNAMDFFTAPQKLYKLFDDTIFSWFLPDASKEAPFLKRVFSRGTMAVFKALELITGEEFIKELREFFLVVSKLRANIFEISKRGESILHHKSTKYYLVTSPDELKIQEAVEIQEAMTKVKLRLFKVFINRAFPTWTEESDPQFISSEIAEYYQSLIAIHRYKKEQALQMAKEMHLEHGIVLLPDLGSDIIGLTGLNKLADQITKDIL